MLAFYGNLQLIYSIDIKMKNKNSTEITLEV